MKKNSNQKLFSNLNKTLFWDYKNIDIRKHYRYIIARVLDYGDWSDVANLLKIYKKEDIIDTIKNYRNISAKTANYWALKYNVNILEMKCMKKY